ncbi:MAG: tryptophan-rich sensory protein [Ruminococcus sp.]|nr:tryptophan-rich sensory protein [Ruminococcus sp.]
MKKIKWTELFISVLIAELAGALSALLSGDFSSFYAEIILPSFSPPPFVFPVLWTILYALMGISAHLVWNEKFCPASKSTAKKLYIAQLSVNFVWSIIFFRFRLPGIAALTAFLLLGLVAAMIVSFRKISIPAAWLNVPYLLWLTFAVYLASGVFFLN